MPSVSSKSVSSACSDPPSNFTEDHLCNAARLIGAFEECLLTMGSYKFGSCPASGDSVSERSFRLIITRPVLVAFLQSDDGRVEGLVEVAGCPKFSL